MNLSVLNNFLNLIHDKKIRRSKVFIFGYVITINCYICFIKLIPIL